MPNTMRTRPSLLPDDDELELVHTRTYQTGVYLVDDGHLLVRGIIVDDKPPGLFIDDDPDPLEIHRMEVELKVRLEDLVVVDARVGFETHPFETCPTIAASYRQLIGLSVARGFNRRVRELFGGPRGCTHTTALLQAMAPAVHQSMWSVSIKQRRAAAEAGQPEPSPEFMEDQRRRAFQANLNTCHIWDEEGERVRLIQAGGQDDHTPVSVRNRLTALGRKGAEWP